MALRLLSFLLVLIRVSMFVAMVPLPGIRSVLDPVRALLAMSVTLALNPFWPNLQAMPSAGQLAESMTADALFGLVCGLWVLALAEGFTMAAQIFSLQAGYGYASTIDPTSEADSGILAVLAQLAAGLLLFASGLHRVVFATLARSLQTWPADQAILGRPVEATAVQFGNVFFDAAVRLALPVVALLLMADLTLALLGRLNAQLQLISMAFPIKMLATLLILAITAPLWPQVYQASVRQMEGLLVPQAVSSSSR